MQFNIGDRVIHPIYGIGHLVSIEEKEFSEKNVSTTEAIKEIDTLLETNQQVYLGLI